MSIKQMQQEDLHFDGFFRFGLPPFSTGAHFAACDIWNLPLHSFYKEGKRHHVRWPRINTGSVSNFGQCGGQQSLNIEQTETLVQFRHWERILDFFFSYNYSFMQLYDGKWSNAPVRMMISWLLGNASSFPTEEFSWFNEWRHPTGVTRVGVSSPASDSQFRIIQLFHRLLPNS